MSTWVNSPAAERAQVGAFFGLVAGVIALLIVAGWALLARRGESAPPLASFLSLHAAYLLLYLVVGALVGALWPLRASPAGRWALWFMATAAGSVTVTSATHGPFWTWPFGVWWRYALTAVAFTFVFSWPFGHGRGS